MQIIHIGHDHGKLFLVEREKLHRPIDADLHQDAADCLPRIPGPKRDTPPAWAPDGETREAPAVALLRPADVAALPWDEQPGRVFD